MEHGRADTHYRNGDEDRPIIVEEGNGRQRETGEGNAGAHEPMIAHLIGEPTENGLEERAEKRGRKHQTGDLSIRETAFGLDDVHLLALSLKIY